MKSKAIIMIAIWCMCLILLGIIIQLLQSGTFNPNYAHAQQQIFTAKLSGQNEMPPIKTQAAGAAKFTVNSNDTLSYEMNVNNIDAVIGARISLKMVLF